jgi:L-2-hydroxyglutarate oxidase LhgO
MTDTEITIIGAGVVGLAIASIITEQHTSVFVIEKHPTFGQETSSRNSEVIHAGIYYPKDSLKARLCVEGNKLLYDFCKKHDIPHKNCGKLIVATSEDEVNVLDGIRQRAADNDVSDLRLIDKEEISALEPNILALKALLSPSTGIIDSHSLMKQYETIAVNNGAQMVYGNEVTGITKTNEGYNVTLCQPDGSEYSFTSKIVINAAGLCSDKISEMLGLFDDNLKIHFCKGQYFRINPPKNRLVNGLVYPVPFKNLDGLGVHITIDLSGGVKLGPDVTYLDENIYDYSVDAGKLNEFYKSAKRFLPFLEPDDIAPEMAGIRPKIQRKGEAEKDFYIKEETARGYPGFINLIGIESPGLTASLAIAKYVSGMLK